MSARKHTRTVAAAGALYSFLVVLLIGSGPVDTPPGGLWGVLAILATGTHVCYLGPILLAVRARRTVVTASLAALGAGLVLAAAYMLGLTANPGEVLATDPLLIVAIALVGLLLGGLLSGWTALFLLLPWPCYLLHLVTWIVPALATVALLAQNLLW